MYVFCWIQSSLLPRLAYLLFSSKLQMENISLDIKAIILTQVNLKVCLILIIEIDWQIRSAVQGFSHESPWAVAFQQGSFFLLTFGWCRLSIVSTVDSLQVFFKKLYSMLLFRFFIGTIPTDKCWRWWQWTFYQSCFAFFIQISTESYSKGFAIIRTQCILSW